VPGLSETLGVEVEILDLLPGHVVVRLADVLAVE
jgi:hypothetical protein